MELLTAIYNYPSEFKYVSGETPMTHWMYPVVIGAIYMTTILGLRAIMNMTAKRIEARWFAAVHNWNMFAISLVCFVGISYGAIKLSFYHGLDGLVCDHQRVSAGKGTLYFWLYIFFLSKFYELLDTVFIVLRKAPLRFLHFYHHSMTFFLCWVCLEYSIPVQWIATSLNAFVHIPMYWYYFMMVVKPGKQIWWKKYITTIQILQFIIVLITHSSAIIYHYAYAKNCRSYEGYGNLFAGLVIWSYLYLFIDFYRSTYTSGKSQAGRKVAKKED
jgi:hypothetical protein